MNLCHHLFVDLVWIRSLAADRRAAQWWDWHRLHGDELHFVREPAASICGARHPIDMLEDGG